jgi:hypothetical protein
VDKISIKNKQEKWQRKMYLSKIKEADEGLRRMQEGDPNIFAVGKKCFYFKQSAFNWASDVCSSSSLFIFFYFCTAPNLISLLIFSFFSFFLPLFFYKVYFLAPK